MQIADFVEEDEFAVEFGSALERIDDRGIGFYRLFPLLFELEPAGFVLRFIDVQGEPLPTLGSIKMMRTPSNYVI